MSRCIVCVYLLTSARPSEVLFFQLVEWYGVQAGHCRGYDEAVSSNSGFNGCQTEQANSPPSILDKLNRFLSLVSGYCHICIDRCICTYILASKIWAYMLVSALLHFSVSAKSCLLSTSGERICNHAPVMQCMHP